MSSLSKNVTKHRAKKAATTTTPKAIITLTEVPGSNGGFSIGLGLHGARMEELEPGKNHPVSIVDVIALAVTHIIRSQPKDFQDSISLVNSTLKNVNTALAEGKPLDETIAEANDLLEGALADVHSDLVPEAAEG